MTRYSIILLMLLSLGSFGQEQKFSTFYYQKKTQFESLPNDRNEIIFLGNSITQGCEWAELLDNRKVKNRGISGDVTAGVLHRLDEVCESKPKKVFLLIGINDLARGKSKEYVFENILKINQQIKASSPKTKVYVQSLLPVNNSFNKFKGHTSKGKEVLWINEQLKSKQDSEGFTYVELHSHFANEDGKLREDFTNDGLHLLGVAYEAWIDIIKPLI